MFWAFLHLSAQNFAPLGAKWTYQIGSGCCNNGREKDFVEWSVVQDTFIHQQNCRMLLKKGISIEGFPDTIFVYQDHQQVYYFDFYSHTFTLLYDFGKQKNESWKIQSGECELNVIVKDVSMVTINGQNLKRLEVTSDNSDYEGHIIEKIGYLKKPQPDFALYCYGLVSYLNYYEVLRCYEDTELGFYDFQIAPSCDYVKVNKEVATDLFFKLFPNPTQGNFTILLLHSPVEPTKIYIYNAFGQQLQEELLEYGNQKMISLNNLSDGIYLLQIETPRSKAFDKIILIR